MLDCYHFINIKHAHRCGNCCRRGDNSKLRLNFCGTEVCAKYTWNLNQFRFLQMCVDVWPRHEPIIVQLMSGVSTSAQQGGLCQTRWTGGTAANTRSLFSSCHDCVTLHAAALLAGPAWLIQHRPPAETQTSSLTALLDDQKQTRGFTDTS